MNSTPGWTVLGVFGQQCSPFLLQLIESVRGLLVRIYLKRLVLVSWSFINFLTVCYAFNYAVDAGDEVLLQITLNTYLK